MRVSNISSPSFKKLILSKDEKTKEVFSMAAKEDSDYDALNHKLEMID